MSRISFLRFALRFTQNLIVFYRLYVEYGAGTWSGIGGLDERVLM